VSGPHRFTATLEAARAGGAIVLVPPDVATALGGLKQMRVFGTLNGVAYRSSTMPYGGLVKCHARRSTRPRSP
jgi:hypothetical protein